jgi:predicted NUDIX family phosphoesterase
MAELVLCVKKSVFQSLVGRRLLDKEFFYDDLLCLGEWNFSQNIKFLERATCEKDFDWLQIIPYVMVSAVKPLNTGRSILVYRRGHTGGESRLHGNMSLGFGGHINPCDAPEFSKLEGSSVMDYVLNCVYRELNEELVLPYPITLYGLGWAYDMTTEVGKVHVGATILAIPGGESASPNGKDIQELKPVPAETLFVKKGPATKKVAKDFESWSQLIIETVRYHGGMFETGQMIGMADEDVASCSGGKF